MKSVATIAIAIALALLACTSPPSAEQELTDLTERATPCGDIVDRCVAGTDPNTVLACMNAALSNGTSAVTGWSSLDDHDFEITVSLFTDGGSVREFDTEPDDYDGPDTVTEDPTCAGPFSLSTQMLCGMSIQLLAVAGCPPPPS